MKSQKTTGIPRKPPQRLVKVVAARPRLAQGIANFLFALREEAVGIKLPSKDVLVRISHRNLRNITIAEFVVALEETRFFDIFSEGVYVLDGKGMLLLANYTAQRLYGSLGEKAPFPLAKVLTEESLREVAERIRNASVEDQKEDLFLFLRKKDGTEIPIKTTPRLLQFKDGSLIVGTITPSILSALMKLHETIAAKEKPEEVFELILDYAMNLFRLGGCAIKTDFNLGDNDFNILGMKGLTPKYLAKRDRPVNKSLSYQAFEGGRIIEETMLDEVGSAAVTSGMRAAMFVPLWAPIGAGQVEKLGTFCLYSSRMEEFYSLRRKVPQIRLYADFIGREIRAVREHQRRVAEAARLNALLRISQDVNSFLLLDQVLDTLVKQARDIFERTGGVRSCSVYVLHRETGELVREASVGRDYSSTQTIKIDDKDSITAIVARSGEPLVVPDVIDYVEDMGLPDGARQGSFMSVPIMVEKEVIAVLNIASSIKDYFIEKEHLPTAEMLAQMAAIAITKAQQHEEIRQRNEEKKYMLMMDHLIPTILNQRFGPFLLNMELQEAIRQKYPYSVLMIDIDFFKDVNDRYGHLIGDKVLQSLGELLKEEVKEKLGLEVVFKFGGEEFVVGLKKHDNNSAREVAEKLRQAIDELVVETEKGSVSITVSIGVASYPAHGSDYESLVGVADAAMYHAKKMGRNRVVASPVD